jgi:phage antirepressor YoqD-like protein
MKMKDIKKFEYNENEITFQLGNGDTMVNATQMAEIFGKRPSKWLELSSTTSFLESLSSIRFPDTPDNQLVRTVMGGPENGGGTWFHEDVALEFARWLSPTFAIWCNQRIKELMTTGATTFQGLPDFKNPVEAARAWADVYEQKQQIETQTKLQQKELQIAAPKVKYYENVLQSNSTYNTNQIAKELGMSAVTLNKKLNKLGVQYKQNKTWLLYHKYQNKSLTKTKTFVFTDTEGNERTRMQTVWTEKGRLFINEKKALL